MLQVLFGDPNEKKVTRYTGLVNQINALNTDIKNLSDKDLQDKTIELTQKINKSSRRIPTLEEYLPKKEGINLILM